MDCGYCRNQSGRTDERGNCASCGAPLESSLVIDYNGNEIPLVLDPFDRNRKIRDMAELKSAGVISWKDVLETLTLDWRV